MEDITPKGTALPEVRTFGFHRSYHQLAQRMDDGRRLRFYDAISNYAFDDAEPSFSDDPFLDALWIAIEPNIAASKAKSRAGSSGGGRPRKSKGTRRRKQAESQAEVTSGKTCFSDDEESDTPVRSTHIPSSSYPLHSSSTEGGGYWDGGTDEMYDEDVVF